MVVQTEFGAGMMTCHLMVIWLSFPFLHASSPRTLVIQASRAISHLDGHFEERFDEDRFGHHVGHP